MRLYIIGHMQFTQTDQLMRILISLPSSTTIYIHQQDCPFPPEHEVQSSVILKCYR